MLINVTDKEAFELYLMFFWVFLSLAVLYFLQRWWTSYR
jgi:hypothetical protein